MTAREAEELAKRSLADIPGRNIMGNAKMQIVERHFAVTNYSNGKLVPVYVKTGEWEVF